MADTYYNARQAQLRSKIDAYDRRIATLSRQEKNLQKDIEKRRVLISGAVGRQYEFDAKRRNAISKGRSHKSYDERLRKQKALAGKYIGQVKRDEEKLKRIQYKRLAVESEVKTAKKKLGVQRQKVRFLLTVDYKAEGVRNVEVEVIMDATTEYMNLVSSLPFKVAGAFLDKFYGQRLVSIARNKRQLGEHRYPPHEVYYAPDNSVKIAIAYKDYDNPSNSREFPEFDVAGYQSALEMAKRIADGAS